jgi:hypothetical protein
MARKRPLEEAVLGGLSGLEGLVEEALAEIDAAEHVLVRDRHLIELHIRLGVLNVGFDQRSAQLDILDQHLFAANGSLNQRSLIRCKLVSLGVAGFLLFRVRASHTEDHKQEGEGDLPKRHVRLLS